MWLKEKVGLIYFLLPFLGPVKNKLELVSSILIGSSNYTIKFKDDTVIRLRSSQYDVMLSLLGAIVFSLSYSFRNGFLELYFDMRNKFTVKVDKFTYEDQTLLELLFLGTRFGANFVTDNNNFPIRDKMFKIYQKNDKKIIETSEGIKFFIDSINAGNTIVETFVNKIHLINSKDDWKDKIVVDVGAECGDTPLYYANLGAKVFSFEPIKAHFEAMLRNISLNPEISHRIIPINAAIGKDEMLAFYQSNQTEIGPTASFVYNIHGKNAKMSQVRGYSLGNALKEFKIEHVDLLKMDCKGCQFFITEKELENIDRVKIEYGIMDSKHKLENLLELLEKAGFKCTIFRINPFTHSSNRIHGTIFGTKL